MVIMGLEQFLLVLVLLVKLEVTSADCPHADQTLERWSEVWGDNKPQEGEQVTLTSGMHILLDETPPPLGSITIDEGAKLVWGDQDGITLTLSYMLIHGEFHMGSEDCRFTKRANIVLTGLSNSTLSVAGFGRKFIGVGKGGVLELHGREKTTWTKLAVSIPPSANTCGVVYDHKKTRYDHEWGQGVHVMVWNKDGSVSDFGVFFTGETWDTGSELKLAQFLDDIPAGKVVALGIHKNFGTEVKPERDWEAVYSAVERLGGIEPTTSQLRQVKDKEAYAFITLSGTCSTEMTMEQHVPRGPNDENTVTDDVNLILWDKKLKFFIESAVLFSNNWHLPHDINFRVVSADIAFPKVEVVDDVSSWMPGDRVVFASTDYDWRQAEEFEVYSCGDCEPNQFRIKGEFKYPHYGKIYDGVDMRGEVALLSRDIVIEGQMEDACYANNEHEKWLCTLYKFDHFGGHLKVVKGFSAAHIQGIELRHMGQQAFTGTYPIHFHMCDDVTGNWARNNSIHHTLARCVTIHGTDGLEVSDNACYDHLGHGYFLEDSVEQYNILDGNLGFGTKHGTHILTDMKNNWCNKTLAWNCNSLSTFWITHYNNYIRNNVAAGSDNAGFWFNYADKPLGASAARQAEKAANGEPAVVEFSTRHTPILEFSNNVAHSNHERGLMFDNRISNGHWEGTKFFPENARFSTNLYDPRVPNTPEGKQVTTYIDRLTVYKNKNENIWLRGGNIVLANSSIADSQRGLTMAKSVRDTFTEVKGTIFIGMSDNLGVGQTYSKSFNDGQMRLEHEFNRSMMSSNPTDPLQGFVFYEGPNYVTDCYFNDYSHWTWNQTWNDLGVVGYRTGGAVSWRRGNMLFFTPQSSITGTKFGFCDADEGNWAYDGNNTVPGFTSDNDGKLQATFHDVDGSVTGVKDTQVVKNLPFFTTPRCSYRQNWDMAACPKRYAKLHIHSDVWSVDKNESPISFVRDDAHEHPFAMKAGQGKSYHLMLNKTFTVHFNKTVPKRFRLVAENMERGDFIRVGVCMPKDMTQFELSSWYPFYHTNDNCCNPIKVDSIEALDQDKSAFAFFWDQNVGMLFLKLMSNETRTDRNPCPNGKCPNFNIDRKDGSDTADCRTSAYGPYIKAPESASDEMAPKSCDKTTSEGFGAGDTRPTPYTESVTVASFGGGCPAPSLPPPEPTAEQFRGCMVDNWKRDMTGLHHSLHSSMTRGFCINRCKEHGFKYAALQNGNECYCDNAFGSFGSGDGCTKSCSGDDETCGGPWRNEVYSTGIVTDAPMERCGPGSRGFVDNGRCLYFSEDRKNYGEAQRACVMMGGNLATISSAETHILVRDYIGQGKNHVWIGLSDVGEEGTFVFMDGTPATYLGGDVKANPGRESDDFIVMDVNHKLAWDDRRYWDQERYLCQLPLDSQNAPEPCGPSGSGRRFGSDGQCYLVINDLYHREKAEYGCLTRQGVLATVDDEATQREMRNHLLLSGVSMDYWINEEAVEGKYQALKIDLLFNKYLKDAHRESGLICRLDSSPTASGSVCAHPWKEHDGSCYLYTGETVSDYTSASALCNTGESSLLTIHSNAENTFVYNMVSDFHNGEDVDVLLGLRFRSVFDDFSWEDGYSSGYEAWGEGQGMSGLSGGQCVKLGSYDGNISWNNTLCQPEEAVYSAVCKLTPYHVYTQAVANDK